MLLRKKYCPAFLLVIVMALCLNASKAEALPVLITDVPSYNWYHGCGPTAVASVIGYYDLHNYDNLFNVSGWDDVRLTANVQDEISSPAHNAKYDSTPDAPGPHPPDTSIADFFRTSEDPLGFGWSYLSYVDDAVIGYADYRGYNGWSVWSKSYLNFTWSDLTADIDNNRPLLFHVDSSGDGGVDHSVPVFGYDDRGASGLWYASYTTWHEPETIDWFQFRAIDSNYRWGVGYASFVQPGSSYVPGSLVTPEPSTMFLLGFGLLGAAGIKRKK
ncbi:PEP-CTERM sorting domain-containing protein [Candidatus Omnitrophota bacterium]